MGETLQLIKITVHIIRHAMTFLQRMILFFLGSYILIGGLVTIFAPEIYYWEFFMVLILIIVAAIFFFIAFSAPKKVFSVNKKIPKSEPNTSPVTIYGQEKKSVNDKIDALINSANEPLYKLSSVFPFDLFTKDIIIDQKQVLIVDRYFFFSGRDYPVLIKNIILPIVDTSFFFATFTLDVVFPETLISIKYLPKKEAYRAKRIIMGLILCDKEKIDLTGLSRDEVLEKVEEIGRTKIK